MAVLRFSFGTMGSGKSTLALQIHHNLKQRGLQGILCSQLDRSGGKVSSAYVFALNFILVMQSRSANSGA